MIFSVDVLLSTVVTTESSFDLHTYTITILTCILRSMHTIGWNPRKRMLQ